METATESVVIDVDKSHAVLQAAREAERNAAEAFEDALAAANDAGYSYRYLAGVVGYGHHYVGDLIKASRERAEADG